MAKPKKKTVPLHTLAEEAWFYLPDCERHGRVYSVGSPSSVQVTLYPTERERDAGNYSPFHVAIGPSTEVVPTGPYTPPAKPQKPAPTEEEIAAKKARTATKKTTTKTSARKPAKKAASKTPKKVTRRR